MSSYLPESTGLYLLMVKKDLFDIPVMRQNYAIACLEGLPIFGGDVR